jgi:8-amino-7-oxononanoate synthase
MDDTQALGIFGHSPSKSNPYGIGGGGILKWSNHSGNPRALVVSSMAKAFGVPVAILSGSKDMISRFKDRSRIRVHCSPPSYASIHAAEHALALNLKFGDKLRLRLLKLVRYFRDLTSKAGFLLRGGVFPVQTLSGLESHDTVRLHEHLFQNGIRTVLHKGKAGARTLLSFIISAFHKFSDIDYLVKKLNEFTRSYLEVNYEIQA